MTAAMQRETTQIMREYWDYKQCSDAATAQVSNASQAAIKGALVMLVSLYYIGGQSLACVRHPAQIARVRSAWRSVVTWCFEVRGHLPNKGPRWWIAYIIKLFSISCCGLGFASEAPD